MKKRVPAILIAIMLLCSTLICAAAEMRASLYFDGYILGVAAEGNCEMSVSFSVFGTDEMDQIGAYSIRIEEEIAKDMWEPSFTVYGSSDTETFYSYNAYDHTGSFTFIGVPDVKYRAVMTAYATNKSGSEYSREITCTGRVCK